ncbi:hypothetical protein BAT_1932 [Bacillus pumilus ATCC 7061]|nr:hypothetical protein BAT_1932 [Bacillus pumilus ATCC 7061]
MSHFRMILMSFLELLITSAYARWDKEYTAKMQKTSSS